MHETIPNAIKRQAEEIRHVRGLTTNHKAETQQRQIKPTPEIDTDISHDVRRAVNQANANQHLIVRESLGQNINRNREEFLKNVKETLKNLVDISPIGNWIADLNFERDIKKNMKKGLNREQAIQVVYKQINDRLDSEFGEEQYEAPVDYGSAAMHGVPFSKTNKWVNRNTNFNNASAHNQRAFEMGKFDEAPIKPQKQKIAYDLPMEESLAKIKPSNEQLEYQNKINNVNSYNLDEITSVIDGLITRGEGPTPELALELIDLSDACWNLDLRDANTNNENEAKAVQQKIAFAKLTNKLIKLGFSTKQSISGKYETAFNPIKKVEKAVVVATENPIQPAYFHPRKPKVNQYLDFVKPLVIDFSRLDSVKNIITELDILKSQVTSLDNKAIKREIDLKTKEIIANLEREINTIPDTNTMKDPNLRAKFTKKRQKFVNEILPYLEEVGFVSNLGKQKQGHGVTFEYKKQFDFEQSFLDNMLDDPTAPGFADKLGTFVRDVITPHTTNFIESNEVQIGNKVLILPTSKCTFDNQIYANFVTQIENTLRNY